MGLIQIGIDNRLDQNLELVGPVAGQGHVHDLRAVLEIDDEGLFQPLDRLGLVADDAQLVDGARAQGAGEDKALADDGRLGALIDQEVGSGVLAQDNGRSGGHVQVRGDGVVDRNEKPGCGGGDDGHQNAQRGRQQPPPLEGAEQQHGIGLHRNGGRYHRRVPVPAV